MDIDVGNLSYNVTENDIRKSFAKSGEVMKATIIKDKLKERSRGFAYVIMGHRAKSIEAFSELNNTDFMWRIMMLKEMPDQRGYYPR